MQVQQTQLCENCRKNIPISKSATHQGYCRRNIIKCLTCDQMCDKNFLEEHEEQFHNTKQCQYCSIKLKNKDFKDHSTTCNSRPKYCQYCQLNVPIKQYSVHLKQCQSRTTPCQLCDKSITNKELIFHMATCRGKDIQFISPPKKQKQHNPEKNKYEIEDSLSYFDMKKMKEPVAEKGFKKQKQIKNQREWENKNRKQSQKEPKRSQIVKKDKSIPIPNIKQKKQQKDILKQIPRSIQRKQEKNNIKNPQQLSRQHFYDNYFNNSSSFYKDIDPFMQNQPERYNPEFNFEQSLSRDYFSPKYSLSNTDYGDQTYQDQLIQQTILQSTKMRKFKSLNQDIVNKIPQDFMSQDIMKSSFYNDILDFQKQKAIQQDIANNKKPSKNKKKY